MASRDQTCLRMPVPASVRSLFPNHQRLPQLSSDQDVQAAIRAFGNEYVRIADEIDKACYLAYGFDDVIILLERPAKDHDYSRSRNDFVNNSPVLHGTDSVIRFVTQGARTISDTSVLDAFMFKALDAMNNVPDKPADNECHDLVQSILEIKRPKTVLVCTNILLDHPLNRFQAVQIRNAPCVQHTKDSSTLIIRCFHPGYCINRVRYDPRSRLALILGFALAFTHTEEERKMLEKAVNVVQPRYQE